MECMVCGSDKNLVEHHQSYFPEITTWLCRSCHGKLHGHKKVRPEGYIPTRSRVINPKIPEKLKERLQKYAKENNITLKQVTIKILDESLPKYNQEVV